MPPRNAASADTAVASSGKAVGALAAEHLQRDPSSVVGVPYPNVPIPTMGQSYTGFLGDNFRDRSLMQRINWLHLPLLAATPLLALYGVLTVPFDWRTYAFAVLYYFFSGLGITAGYHRLFAHRSYKATKSLSIGLMLAGTAAVEGSLRWWARDHRAHHKYVDTDRDPYSAVKGFWYAHVGWMLVKQDADKIGRVSIKDLNEDPIVRFQHRYYLPLAAVMGLLVPTIVCGLLWGDWKGGYFIAGVARLVFVHHSTFFVNSLAHFAGAADYSDAHTARNSWITALLTLGEGNHNFHHERPDDYRNGIKWYEYDPTKLFIKAMSLLGLAYDLKTYDDNEIAKGVLQMTQKRLEGEKRRLDWGPNPAALPAMDRDAFDARAKAGLSAWLAAGAAARTNTTAEGSPAGVAAGGRIAGSELLVAIDGFVLDLAPFAASHPGGEGYITAFVGKDATLAFHGAEYKHSVSARNLQAMYRIARLDAPAAAQLAAEGAARAAEKAARDAAAAAEEKAARAARRVARAAGGAAVKAE